MTAVEETAGFVAQAAKQEQPKRRGSAKAAGLPAAPKRQRNTTWLLVGALLVVGSGIAGLSIAASLSNRVDVVVASRDIAEGEVLEERDFATAAVGLSGGAVAINPADIPELVGRVAGGPIGQGAIVHPDYFDDVDAGEYPRVGMQPGDQVVVIAIGEQAFDEADEAAREVGDAEVVEVAPLAGADSYLVSLRVDSRLAPFLATLASQDRLSLALEDVADGGSAVRPIAPVSPVDPLRADEQDEAGDSEGDGDTTSTDGG